LLLSGNHPRHLFIHQAILEAGFSCAAVIMQREDLLPNADEWISSQDKLLFHRHFEERYELENAAFGSLKVKNTFSNVPTHYCESKNLNSSETIKFVIDSKPDIAFIFGTDLIKGELFRALPENKINLHLGLSPWYRGSATLFWPFYFLQPQFSGATFHQIVPEADAGGILHQTVPLLKMGDGVHDVGVRTVLGARADLIRLLELYSKTGKFEYHMQKSSGRLFLTRDFQAAHLRLVYDLYENKVVDEYLKGNLQQNLPKVINAF
jgi:methionyl-tRNA formyltransferase